MNAYKLKSVKSGKNKGVSRPFKINERPVTESTATFGIEKIA